MGSNDLAYDLGSDSVGSNAHIEASATSPIASGGPAQSADALLYVHPDYLDYEAKWGKYTDCYLARNIYQFLHQHSREHNDAFEKRIKRGYYYNYVASIVDLYIAYLFECGVTRQEDANKDLAEAFGKLYSDATRSNIPYSLFIKMAATFALVNGHAGILVDMPSAKPFANKAEADLADHRPYLTLIQAYQIMDWELDDKNNFEWVKIEVAAPQGRDWKTPYDETTRTFLIWSKTSWEKWQVFDEYVDSAVVKSARLIQAGENPLGEVPLVILRNERSLSHSWIGESAIRDIADINIAILNWSSLMDEEIYNRCLNILTMQRDDSDAPIEISHHNVLLYEEGANPPDYLKPSETPMKLIGESIDRARDEIYRIAKLGGSTGLLGVREATSGVAYAFEFNETNQSLASKAEYLETAENDIHRLVAKWYGKDTTVRVIYPREFGVDDFLLELQVLTESRATLTSETAIKEIEKRVITKMFAKDEQELRSQIIKEIESPKSPVFDADFIARNFTTQAKAAQKVAPQPQPNKQNSQKTTNSKNDTITDSDGRGEKKSKAAGLLT